MGQYFCNHDPYAPIASSAWSSDMIKTMLGRSPNTKLAADKTAAIVVIRMCFTVCLFSLLRRTVISLFLLLWHDCASGAVPNFNVTEFFAGFAFGLGNHPHRTGSGLLSVLSSVGNHLIGLAATGAIDPEQLYFATAPVNEHDVKGITIRFRWWRFRGVSKRFPF